jgi:transposase
MAIYPKRNDSPPPRSAISPAGRIGKWSQSATGGCLRRKKAQLGAPKAIAANARKIARNFYEMMKTRMEYKDLGVEYYQNRYKERMFRNLKRKAKALGLKLVDPDQLAI